MGVSVLGRVTVSLLPLLLSGCGACGVTSLGDVPGGFDPAARIPRAAQVRLTQPGLDALSGVVGPAMRAGARQACGVAEEVPCPSGFVGSGGAPLPASCDAARGLCVEPSGQVAPSLGLAVPRAVVGQVTLCRDDPAAPERRACHAWVRVEGLALGPALGVGLEATVQVQLASGAIPVRHAGLDLDCLLVIEPASAPAPLELVADVALAPANPGGELTIAITAVRLNLPDAAIRLEPDPIHGDAADVALCTAQNVAAVKPALTFAITTAARDLLLDLFAGALGRSCASDAGCPSGAACASGRCTDAAGRLIADLAHTEERLRLPAVLDGLGYGGQSARADTALVVGGSADTDTAGLVVGVLAGVEPVDRDPRCARASESPRARPGFSPPPPLPGGALADLDHDGTPETPYGLALGFSRALLQQIAWTAYSAGLFCGRLGGEGDQLDTGALELLIPSVRFLTRSHLWPRAHAPARVTIHVAREPRILLGSGRVTETPGGEPRFEDALLHLHLDDLSLDLFALVEERWTRLMTVTLDVHLGLGVTVTPDNRLEPVLGVGVADVVSNVRITNSGLLAESVESLESAIPTLISLALLEYTGPLGAVALPEVSGLELEILGVRGVGAAGRFENAVVYAGAALAGSAGQSLSAAVRTEARLVRLVVPPTAAFAVTHPAGPVWPHVELALAEHAPTGERLEHQVRVDGGLWSPFFTGDRVTLRRPELLVQGVHEVEVRSRIRGQYRTLDPAPVRLEVRVDSEPPRLEVRSDHRRGGVWVRTFDRVSGARVALEVVGPEGARALAVAEDGFAPVPELAAPSGRLAVRATDEAGLWSEVVIAEAPRGTGSEAPASAAAGPSCRGAGEGRGGAWSALMLLGLAALTRRRARGVRR